MGYVFCSSFAFEVVILLGNEQIKRCVLLRVAHTWLTDEHGAKLHNFSQFALLVYKNLQKQANI